MGAVNVVLAGAGLVPVPDPVVGVVSVTVGGGEIKRSQRFDSRPGSRIRAGSDQYPDHCEIVMINGPVQSGHAVRLRRVHIGFLSQERAHGAGVGVHGGIGEGA